MPVPALGQDSLLLIGLSPLVSLSPLRGLHGLIWLLPALLSFQLELLCPVQDGLCACNTQSSEREHLLSKPSITRVPLCPASLVILLLFQSQCDSRENESAVMTIATPKTRAPVVTMSREKLEPSNQTGRFGTSLLAY